MKTKTGYTFYEKTIIDNIDLEGYSIFKPSDDLFNNINKVYDVFVSEYGHMVERVGERKAFKEWLQGLPSALTVPFYYHEMIKNYNNFTGTKLNELSEVTFCERYFEMLSHAFFTLKENL